ncbi:MAG TPA: DUF1232 domain-containing protein [Candidatus Hydrothermia bacterium]|nr:DUF1232 domain-containing protein [Candidatus Hydrothermae bacterium]MDD3649337.1 DUF1232 domain-containing protein [Candidatus Hydrothermia bacterium]MDD5572567.1 DUF1232 domain-containing protein [Candidatus Hydrothermia bacterium]HOK22752.1 DUF1232 domain-containing protein [Candidatus Hydrothermia bacterium]HOL23461.1 DUF1232 domain-containing protein [Candidatus Hydrothermia bacterium]
MMENTGSCKKKSVDGFLSFYYFFRHKVAIDAEKTFGKYGKVVAEILLTGPDLFIFLFRLYKDTEVSLEYKIALGSILAYWVIPLDFLSEMFTGVLGYIDDIFLAAYVLNGLIKQLSAEKLQSYWPGSEEAQKVISKILEYSETISKLLGKNSKKKLDELISRIYQRVGIEEPQPNEQPNKNAERDTKFE